MPLMKGFAHIMWEAGRMRVEQQCGKAVYKGAIYSVLGC